MKNRQRISWKKRAILFLISQCITLFGSTLVQMALVWYATMQTSSGAWVASFTICSYLPQFFISFLGGIWADRYNRKILIASADSLIAFHPIRLYCPACLLCRPFVLSVQEFKPRQCKL